MMNIERKAKCVPNFSLNLHFEHLNVDNYEIVYILS